MNKTIQQLADEMQAELEYAKKTSKDRLTKLDKINEMAYSVIMGKQDAKDTIEEIIKFICNNQIILLDYLIPTSYA